MNTRPVRTGTTTILWSMHHDPLSLSPPSIHTCIHHHCYIHSSIITAISIHPSALLYPSIHHHCCIHPSIHHCCIHPSIHLILSAYIHYLRPDDADPTGIVHAPVVLCCHSLPHPRCSDPLCSRQNKMDGWVD